MVVVIPSFGYEQEVQREDGHRSTYEARGLALTDLQVEYIFEEEDDDF